jgi:hypothetical protein
MNPFAAQRHKPGMGAISENATRPGRRRLKAAGLAIGLLLLVGFVLVAPILWLAWLDPFGGSPHPSDAQLTAQLAIHRGELEQLVAMAREDERLQRLAPDFMRPENAADAGVDARRIEEYRALLARAGVAHGILNGDSEVWFLVSTRGLSIAGSAKGFVFCAQPDPDVRIVATDLDREPVPPRGELVMRHLDGPWWLMLDTR